MRKKKFVFNFRSLCEEIVVAATLALGELGQSAAPYAQALVNGL